MRITDIFLTKRSRAENQAEKIKDYRNIVLLQTAIIASALLLKEIFSMAGMDAHLSSVIRDLLFLLFGGLYVLILWDLLRNFTKKTALVTVLFLVIMGSYVLALFTVNPLYHFFHTEAEKRPYLFLIHLVLFSTEAIVIATCISAQGSPGRTHHDDRKVSSSRIGRLFCSLLSQHLRGPRKVVFGCHQGRPRLRNGETILRLGGV